jgi:hypothetical protein
MKMGIQLKQSAMSKKHFWIPFSKGMTTALLQLAAISY